jgi:hypothetical protein
VFLKQHFGNSGPWFYAISRGPDNRPVKPNRPRKSSGSETTLSNDLTNPCDIEANEQAMADEVWSWCRKAQAFGRTVTVKNQICRASSGHAQPYSAHSHRLSANPPRRQHFRRQHFIRAVLPPAQGIRLVGVTASGFDRADQSSGEQLDLCFRIPKRLRNSADPDPAPSMSCLCNSSMQSRCIARRKPMSSPALRCPENARSASHERNPNSFPRANRIGRYFQDLHRSS